MSIKIWDYAERGTNAKGVTVGKLDLYFSYKTIIAFETIEGGLVIRQNDWSTTTGGHLNSINSDKKLRIPSEEFEAKLAEMLKKHNLQ